MKKSCFVLAAEMSGEEHLLSFLPELMARNKDCHFYGVGGDRLQALGVELLYHLKDFSSWGLVEVFHKLPFYFTALRKIQDTISKRNTSVAILVDFQEANYYLAKKLTKKGVKVLYYVAPQAWGWRSYRAQGLIHRCHKLYTILPFEKEWFSQRGVKQVVSVAHPLSKTPVQHGPENFTKTPLVDILLLPGSRNAEVSSLLETFLNTCLLVQNTFEKKLQRFTFRFSLIQGPSVRKGIFQYWEQHSQHPIYKQLHFYTPNELEEVLSRTHFCLAASGTVTLQTSLFQVPTLVCYKAHLFTAFIFYQFIKYKAPITLTNLILAQQKRVLPEYLQDEVTEYNLFLKMKSWLENPKEVEEVRSSLAKVLPLLKGDYPSPVESMDEVIKNS